MGVAPLAPHPRAKKPQAWDKIYPSVQPLPLVNFPKPTIKPEAKFKKRRHDEQGEEGRAYEAENDGDRHGGIGLIASAP